MWPLMRTFLTGTLTLTFCATRRPVPETIYYNKGVEISGVSVAAAARGRLLIGPIFESKILDCAWGG